MNKAPCLALLLTGAAVAATVQSDVEYGRAGDVSLKMDASIPDGAGPFPTVILVHGGGWQGGDKQKNVNLFYDSPTKAGFTWFTVNYRLAPRYLYPAAVDDVVTAIRYVQAHAAEYKVDRNRFAIAGESAGGHIVALIGARYGSELRLAAVVPFFPPTDLEALEAGADKTPNAIVAVKAFLGFSEVNDETIQLMREASPITYVAEGMPPFLFVHGTADQLVNFHQSEAMCQKMKQAGSFCEIFPVEGGGHAFGSWERDPAKQAYKQKVPEWLLQTMR